MGTISKEQKEQGSKILTTMKETRKRMAMTGKMRAMIFTDTRIDTMSLTNARKALKMLNKIVYHMETRLEKATNLNIITLEKLVEDKK